jgi:threonine dehydrogenase-like Zn-dependent dehydrogenase
MITHRFPLSEWKRAISTIARVKRTGAVKVLLRPTT